MAVGGMIMSSLSIAVGVHEVIAVNRLLSVMREPQADNSLHIITVTIDRDFVSVSKAAPRGRVARDDGHVDTIPAKLYTTV